MSEHIDEDINERTAAKVHPPAASAGGDNAYYLPGCEVVQRSPSYASCLFKISEIQAGRTQDAFDKGCVAAIEGRQCRAIAMRQEEELQGVALYYFPRQYINGTVVTSLTPKDSYRTPKPAPSRFSSQSTVAPIRPAVTAPTKPKSTSVIGQIDDTGYANVIKTPTPAAVQAHQPPPDMPEPRPLPSAPASKPALVAKPGESPLQAARRLLEQRQSSTTAE